MAGKLYNAINTTIEHMSTRYFATILIIGFLNGFNLLCGQTGHSISVTVNHAAEIKVRLAYHVGNQQYVKDSTITDKSGKSRFTGSEKLAPGVYMIVLPGNTFFEFLLGDDQHFDMACDLNDPAGTLVFTGSSENSRFLEYQKRWKELLDEALALSEKLRTAPPSGPEAANLKAQLTAQEKRMKQYLAETAEGNKGTLLGAIARSIISVEPHEPAIPAGTVNRDSVGA